MPDVLLVQLARMGDFLQTTPLIEGIKRSDPETRLWVLVDKSIEGMARRDVHIDRVLSLDVGRLGGIMAQGPDLDRQYGSMKEEIEFLSGLRFDRVINVNLSKISALCALFPEAPEVVGYTFAQGRSKLIKGPWFGFVFSMTRYGTLAPFNLVDIFSHLRLWPFSPGTSEQLGTPPGKLRFHLEEREIRDGAARLAALGIEPNAPAVAFQMGSRQVARQWPVEYFTALAGDLIRKKNAHILLLGTAEERNLGREFEQRFSAAEPGLHTHVHNLMGETSLSELAAVLADTDLLVTGDTGTMHVACAVGCRVLALFFGPAWVYQTGPYGSDHWIFQVKRPCGPCTEERFTCEDFPCRKDIRPEMVLEAVTAMLDRREPAIDLSPEVDLLQSRTDGWGVVYEPLTKRPATEGDILNLTYREMGKCVLDPAYGVSGEDIAKAFDRYSMNGGRAFESRIEQIVKSGIRLVRQFTDDPYLTFARQDEALSFWFPWIDFLDDRMGENGRARSEDEKRAVHTLFKTGVELGLKVLKTAFAS